MSVVFWLEKALELAKKEEARIEKEIIDLMGFKPLAEIDLKEYLAISVEERLASHDKLTTKAAQIMLDISKISNLIWAENVKRRV